MLAEPKLHTLQNLLSTSSKEEIIWINGFLAGIMHQQTYLQTENRIEIQTQVEHQTQSQINTIFPSAEIRQKKISLVYGTETGNSKGVASNLAGILKQKGHQVKLMALNQYRLADLEKEEYFLTVVSTHGDGEAPAAAKKFYDHIFQNKLNLSKLQFAVLGLGDSAYPLFCQTGEDIDRQLEKLGGKRLLPLQKCDTDFKTTAQNWFEKVIAIFQNTENQIITKSVSSKAQVQTQAKTGRQYYKGKIGTNLNLNDRGSNKTTHHIEILLDEEVSYQVGDSAGILATNNLVLVEAILENVGAKADQKINYKDQNYTFRELLTRKVNILYLPIRLVQRYSQIVGQAIPEVRIDLLDLLKIYPVPNLSIFEQVLQILEPITPRLYSIASSPNAHVGELHLTVGKNQFKVNGELRVGLCSNYLLNLPENTEIEFYIQPNDSFRLPKADQDIIMLSAGTGIAPFRAFLAERDSTGASGRNWLFFGEQHFQTDFLYQTEIQAWAETHLLTNINTAFSRDQAEKIYIQHRLLQKGAELWHWIEGGAYLYICGAKNPMSEDVDKVLLEIIQKFGGKNPEKAAEYLAELQENSRYQKDVY